MIAIESNTAKTRRARRKKRENPSRCSRLRGEGMEDLSTKYVSTDWHCGMQRRRDLVRWSEQVVARRPAAIAVFAESCAGLAGTKRRNLCARS
jgi:hypothetical protein